MKKRFLLSILLCSSSVYAEHHFNVHLINNSEFPVTVSYLTCLNHYANGGPSEDCHESTVELSARQDAANSGINHVALPMVAEGTWDNGYETVVYIKKIHSALGEQNFDTTQKPSDTHFQTCISHSQFADSNLIVLDNMGTSSMFCLSNIAASTGLSS